jgi:ABC-2 type transport system permease protein
MNGARQSWLVAVREIRERGRSRAFLASLLLMLIGVAAVIALPALLETGPEARDVGVVGDAPAELPAVLVAQGRAVETSIRTHRFETVEAGEDAVRAGDVDVLVVDARQLEWRSRADEQLQAIVTGAIQLATISQRASAAGITPAELAAVIEPVPVASRELGLVAGRSPDDETAAFIMTLVLFGAISTYGAMVLSGVVEEKSSRTVEVLLARMPARSLLAGKIAGIGLLGLAQIAATGIVALVAVTLADSIDLPSVRVSVVAWAVVWFLIGYALYATVFGALGSLASRTEDASSVAGPITIVLVLGFMVSFATLGSVESAWARAVAWIPFTAPMAMPIRIAMGAATWWEPFVAAALAIATIAGLVVLGGRVYTRAILHGGATLTLGEAWRGASSPSPVDESPPPTHSGATDPAVATARVRRPEQRAAPRLRAVRVEITFVALALAAGGAVFALTGDVVIGVGAGAACYAVAKRARPLWRGVNHRDPTVRDPHREQDRIAR